MAGPLTINQIYREDIPAEWASIEPFLQRVIGRFDPRQNLEATLALALAGRQQIHVIRSNGVPLAVIVTEIVQYANGFRELQIPGLAGSALKSFSSLLVSYLRRFMEQEECDVASAMVRRGLVKEYERVGLELSPLVPMILRPTGE